LVCSRGVEEFKQEVVSPFWNKRIQGNVEYNNIKLNIFLFVIWGQMEITTEWPCSGLMGRALYFC
jgi:hypothetical protein